MDWLDLLAAQGSQEPSPNHSSETPSLRRSVSLSSLVAQMVEHLPTMWEIRVQSLGREDLLEEEMAAHSSIHAWKIAWMEELGRLQSMGL